MHLHYQLNQKSSIFLKILLLYLNILLFSSHLAEELERTNALFQMNKILDFFLFFCFKINLIKYTQLQ